MSNIRHVVVVRKDLQLSLGLLAAQVAHISDQFMREKIRRCFFEEESELKFLPPFAAPNVNEKELEWCKDPYLSVLAVNCAEDLKQIIEHAKSEELKVRSWEDTIPSPTFPDKAIKLVVGVSIGPDDFDKIKIVTGALPLY